MTEQEFDTFEFTVSTKIRYRGVAYHLVSVNFETGVFELSQTHQSRSTDKKRSEIVRASFYACSVEKPPQIKKPPRFFTFKTFEHEIP